MPIPLILNIKIFSMAVERPDLAKLIIFWDSVNINRQDTLFTIAVVLEIKMYLIKIFNIFTSVLAKDQNLLLLRCIRQPFNLSTAEK